MGNLKTLAESGQLEGWEEPACHRHNMAPGSSTRSVGQKGG